jgi:hypothetical protein
MFYSFAMRCDAIRSGPSIDSSKFETNFYRLYVSVSFFFAYVYIYICVCVYW